MNLLSILDEFNVVIRWVIRELSVPILLIFILIFFGTSGYSLIEGWGFLDSLYMTMITLSTTGFKEVHPLSVGGVIFTIVLIFLGVAVVTGVFTAITQKVIKREFSTKYSKEKMMEQIERLKGHTIICGFGRLSRIAAADLKRAGKEFIIVDKDEGRLQEAQHENFLVIQGDATLDETLISAGIHRAKNIVSLLPKDSDNMYVVMTSRELEAGINIVSRAEDEVGEKRLKRAGADKIISPYRVGGQKIAEGILKPYVTDFLDIASSVGHESMHIEQILIPPNSPLAHKSLQDADIRKSSNVIVVAIIDGNGEMYFNPAGSTTIRPGSTFIALGKRGELNSLENLLLGS